MLGFVLVLVIVIFLIRTAFSLHKRTIVKKDGVYRAWHIFLPGLGRIYWLESNFHLDGWKVSKIDEPNQPELSEGEGEKAFGESLLKKEAFRGYVLKERSEGHWMLHRDATTRRYFTFSMPVRVGPLVFWRLTDEQLAKKQAEERTEEERRIEALKAEEARGWIAEQKSWDSSQRQALIKEFSDLGVEVTESLKTTEYGGEELPIPGVFLKTRFAVLGGMENPSPSAIDQYLEKLLRQYKESITCGVK